MERNNIADNDYQLIKSCYFLFASAEGRNTSFHGLLFAQTEEELREKMNNAYSGSDGEVLLNYTVEELKIGQYYMLGSRMGNEKTREDIMLVHDSNVEELFRYLDRAFTTNKKGDRVFLSDYIKKASSIDQIEQIVDIYNDSWQNYW